MPNLEIFSQGEEIVTGQTVDTNAAWLSERAVELGFTVTRHTAVGDKLGDLIALLKEIAERADCCLCTGGLGPTSDDLTAEAVAQAFGLPLVFDAVAYEQIGRYFKNRNRPMPESNRKQALLPQGAIRLDNDWGTAPGFAVQAEGCWLAFMPGVPSEMRAMFSERIKPLLDARFTLAPSRLATIKTNGIGESDIQQLIGTIPIPDGVALGFRAGPEEVQTKLLFPADYPDDAMAALTQAIAERLGPRFVFGIDGLDENTGSLASVVDRLMCAAGLTLTIVETASQGLMAAKCLGYEWLVGSVYERSLEALAKRFVVAVNTDDLAGDAQALANAVWSYSRVDIALVQLYAGTNAQFSDKDQTVVLYTTLVHNVEDAETHCCADIRCVWGSATRKQNQAALFGLDLLRRHLQNIH